MAHLPFALSGTMKPIDIEAKLFEYTHKKITKKSETLEEALEKALGLAEEGEEPESYEEDWI